MTQPSSPDSIELWEWLLAYAFRYYPLNAYGHDSIGN